MSQQKPEIVVRCKEKNTFCLNMIVKNEAHVIEDTLNKLLEKMHFDYWVISDTGSTDGTQEIIKSYFKKRNIEGELFEDVWKDFGYNRTRALSHAFNKSDYLLIFDADDELCGNLILPKYMYADAYNLLFRTPGGVYYNRPLLIKNDRKWKFKGVLHEYLALCEDEMMKREIIYANIEGDYYVISGKQGDRSKNPLKYMMDALKLEFAYLEEQEQVMKERYAFYCANSYNDHADFLQMSAIADIKYETSAMNKDFVTNGKSIECYEKAIEWYKRLLVFNNWKQEKYIACLRIYRCYCKLNKKLEGIPYLIEAFKYDPQRIECITELVIHCVLNEMYEVGYAYYSLISHVFENNDMTQTNIHEKLFLELPTYHFKLPHYMIVICDKLQKYVVAKQMFRKIFKHKLKVNANDINCVLYNIQTVIDKSESEEKDREFNMMARSYIQFLSANGYDVKACKCLHLYEKHGIVDPSVFADKGLENQPLTTSITFKTEESESMNKKKILFYTGYTDKKWNLSQSLTGSLGGSERAVIYLSKCFPKEKYHIYITGTVENETQDNIQFVDLNRLPELLAKNTFDIMIVSRYVSFFELYKFNSKKIFVWGHDTVLINYGCNLSVTEILEKWNKKIDGYVCLTEWQKEVYERLYPMIYGKIHIINNGIDLTLFEKHVKVKNSFVFSSRSERGLARLLELWPKIIELYPDARLNICSYVDFPKNQQDELIQKVIEQHKDSIKHHGKLNQKQLYELMGKSEYWLYPSMWPETSCITSMEMLKSGVTCIYYPEAGLPETIGNLGFSCRKGNEIDVLENISEQNKEYMRNRGYEHAITCSWESRYKKWEKLFDHGVIKIVNLARRPDRKNAMIQKLKDVGITNYEFIEAVDGKKVELTPELKKMFVGNDFGDKKGVIGCALSHYGLWQNLIDDPDNNYYIIYEDDIVFANDFAEKLKLCCEYFVKYQIEYLFIGALFINEKNTHIKDLQFIIGKNLNFGGTYGYIISKGAAKKVIDYIELNGIRHAIDNPMIYKSLNSMYHLNQWIVYSDSFQLHNNLDTDIQTDQDRFDFSTVKLPKKVRKYDAKTPHPEMRNISFCDFWTYEYSGGSFDPNNNYLINMIRKYSDKITINLTEPNMNTDIIIYSLFGKTNYRYTDQRRIFFSGEATGICQDADYNITFNYDSVNNCRLPLWIFYIDNDLIQTSNQRKQGIYDIPSNRTKFCSFICGNPGAKNHRKPMVDKISEYKTVDSGGYFMNNIGYIVPRGINCSGKIEHNNNYKFVIAFENTEMDGYCTEKICDAFKSNCIPIYWGTKDVVMDFNPKCFINVNDYKNLDELNRWIEKVDTDPEIYASYFKEPIFSDYWLDIFNDPDHKFFKKLVKNIIG